MRRLELLINEARLSTNTTDINSVSTLLCQAYTNRIQSYLEDLLFLVNDENDLFLKDHEFSLVPGQDEYDLPVDIYAKSSIDTVAVSFLNGLSQTFLPLKKVSRKQRGFTFGYFVQESKVVFTPKPMSPLKIKLTYQRKLPSLSVRVGQVTSFAGNTVNFDELITGYQDVSDFYTIVDFNGVIKQSGIQAVSQSEGSITAASAITGISAGDYVVCGKYATTHSNLPSECEKYLITALERMIQYRQSSPDIKVSDLFSKEELETIKEVFADNSYDDAKPPVTEWQEWLP